MNIEITTNINQTTHSLDSTRWFGINLNKILSNIKMIHWYTDNYNVHKITKNFYKNLESLFDQLQEEIIGTSKIGDVLFPSFNNIILQSENIEDYIDQNNLKECYGKNIQVLKAMITSLEFDNYINSVSSGLNNIKEEILSEINKTNYLLSMTDFL